MRVAILQSNYLPWKGYFDIIRDVDLFIFHDDLQYTKGDWRNRNRIKTADGTRWLTIPVGTSERRRICDVPLPAADWQHSHWRRLEAAYRAAPYFDHFRPWLADVYRRRRWTTLAGLNQTLTVEIAREFLGIRTAFADSRGFALTQRKGARVLELLAQVGARRYVSGPAARGYLDERACLEAGVVVEWKDYGGYPAYEQLHPPFDHQVSILDVLFHTGPDAPWHIWGWRADRDAAVA